MCGICGVIQIGGEARFPVEAPRLDRMTDMMVHRGPNDRGTHLAPGVALGARRLSIIDVEGGHQPVANEDGSVIAIQNGELYNHSELRERLLAAGHRFWSRCDTEILPHLYEAHDEAFVEHLRGKFALAVWDERRRRAIVARDRLGVKPLYYAVVGDLVVFASELKSVLASGLVEPALDLDAVDAYLALGFFPAPFTPFAQVRKLSPGERLIVDAERVRVERYWRFPPPGPVERPGWSVDARAEELLGVLEESIRLRLMSDVPIGAMLSGGLDSSLLVALMARNMPAPVKTFSVGFSDAGLSNELADAREIASLYGTEHHELELSLEHGVVDPEELVWHLDEPLADLSSLGLFALSQLASQSVTVALSGQGADELLGGYVRHRNAKLASWWQRLPRQASTLASRAASHPGRVGRAVRFLDARDPVERQLAAFDRAAPSRTRLLRGRLRELDGAAARAAIRARLDGAPDDPLAAMLHLDGQLGLPDDMLHYFDRVSMAHSLEVRVPFVDHVVVEHCSTLPAGLKIRGMRTKYLLRRAARGLVPDRIIDKPKVGFFNAAVGQWFESQMTGALGDYLLDPAPAYADLLERAEVEQLVRSRRRDAGTEHLLLSVLMLEIWLSTFVSRALKPIEQTPARAALGG